MKKQIACLIEQRFCPLDVRKREERINRRKFPNHFRILSILCHYFIETIHWIIYSF